MHVGGGSGAGKAVEWARQWVTRVARTPASGLAVIAPLVFAGAVAAAPGPATGHPEAQKPGVTPLAAVAPESADESGPAVVAVNRAPDKFHVAAATMSAPPPAVVVNSPGALGIPTVALSAYRNAERMMALADPGCGVSWNLLAGIGRIESLHANGGATDAHGTAVQPIYGPALDGSLPGNEIIVQSRANGRVTYARAIGPMQFLPGTWARYAADGDGDGKAEVQNLFDSALAAARYLCSGGMNLRDQSQVITAVLRYNNSMPYTRNVLGWAAAYATGVVPVDLPPITGAVPTIGDALPIGDSHLELDPAGLGPGLPINVLDWSSDAHLARTPLVYFAPTEAASQLPYPGAPAGPGMLPGLPPNCGLLCFNQSPMPPVVPPGAALPGPLPGGPLPGPVPGGPLPGPPPVGPLPGPVPGPAAAVAAPGVPPPMVTPPGAPAAGLPGPLPGLPAPPPAAPGMPAPPPAAPGMPAPPPAAPGLPAPPPAPGPPPAPAPLA